MPRDETCRPRHDDGRIGLNSPRGVPEGAGVDVEFLLGPAGTGKTHRCLADLRAELTARPEGAPLVFLAPKQATFQLERQLLSDGSLAGFTRLQILSFPRLAHFLLGELGAAEPRLVDETGRVMVLRALLRRHRDSLEVFHRSAALPGFAGELSRQLREFQEQRLTPTDLEETTSRPGTPRTLAGKLRDTALLARAYAGWLQSHGLMDPDALLDAAALALREARRSGNPPPIAGVWLDGFAEMTPQELQLLTELVAVAGRSTLAFCLEDFPDATVDALSPWSVVGDTFRRAHARVTQEPGLRVRVTRLGRQGGPGRFAATPGLAHVEAHWRRPRLPEPATATTTDPGLPTGSAAGSVVELLAADSAEAEALLAAQAIQGHVANGGRYRDCAVLLRSLDTHGDVIRRTWRRLGLPLFLDRREPVGNEPLTTLTRCALRLVPGGWAHEDWFGALRSGLAGIDLEAVDQLENEALAAGWGGHHWSGGNHDRTLPRHLASRLPLFRRFTEALGGEPSGGTVADALTALWQDLDVTRTLEQWDGDSGGAGVGRHRAVQHQLEGWVEELRRALGTTSMPVQGWLEVFESAWTGLTVGLVPPALDQVLVGAIDRSRNPDLALVVLPGWNEGQFPRAADATGLLTPAERRWLQTGADASPMRLPEVATLAREGFLAYIALTRAARRVRVTWTEGPPPAAPRSRYVTRLERLGIRRDADRPPARAVDLWREHPVGPLPPAEPEPGTERLSPSVAEACHGRVLTLSATRLERMAACPHQSFLQDTLRVRERDVLQFEALEQGDMLHRILAEYHRQVQASGASWADPDPATVAARLQEAAATIRRQDGTPSTARQAYAEDRLIRQLLRFVLDTARWMSHHAFRPESAEQAFGGRPGSELPALRLDLSPTQSVLLEGTLDRVDRGVEAPHAVIVVDYKSRERTWKQAAVDAGLELQLPVYALALKAAGRVVGGAAYASLKPSVESARSRGDAGPSTTPPYPHRGLFSAEHVPPGKADRNGLPFHWDVKADGTPKSRSDRKLAEVFEALLAGAEERVRQLARDLLAGTIRATPHPKADPLPCERCELRAACRRP